MVFSCIPFSDTVLHQTGQRWEDVDRRIDGLSVERTVKHDLSLRDISGQVRDRVSDIVVRHGKDRKLCHGAFHALHDAGALIDRRQLAVQIAREAFTAGDLSFGGGDLTHCLGERSHIRQDDKDMHVLLKGQIFGHCKRHLRGDQTLHDRIVRKVQEHCDMVRNAAFLKGVPEEIRNVVLYAHGGEHDGELLIGTFAQRRLLYDLCRELIMGKPVSGEDRKLLPADQCGQSIDRRDAGMDIVPRILTADRVERKPVYIPLQSRDDGAEIVDGLSDAVEGAPQHIRGECDLHGMSGQLRVCILQGHILGALEDLDHSPVLVDLHDTPDLSLGAVHDEFHDLIVEGVLYALQRDQRAVDAA